MNSCGLKLTTEESGPELGWFPWRCSGALVVPWVLGPPVLTLGAGVGVECPGRVALPLAVEDGLPRGVGGLLSVCWAGALVDWPGALVSGGFWV